MITMASAIRRHNDFKKISFVHNNCAMYETDEGKLFAVFGEEETIKRYAGDGKWLNKLNHSYDLWKPDVESRVYFLRKLIFLFDRKKAGIIFRNVETLTRNWNKSYRKRWESS